MTAPHPALRATLSPQAGRGATAGGGRRPDEGPADPDDFLLTASTSEAYSFLFKLLTDPGDEIVTATPSYPLLDQLAALEQITIRTFPLEFHRRWEMHGTYVKANTRAIVVVNPNNPTGSFVTPAEQDAVAAVGIPVISDEVFLDYPLEGSGTSFVRDDILTFTLGGLSKSAGLPHFKLAWIRVSGPGKREALEALELIADNFLSVATPVQVALPDLLRIAPRIREAIQARTRANLATLRAAHMPSAQVLPVEGGWSAVIRVPRIMSDEELRAGAARSRRARAAGIFFRLPRGISRGVAFDERRDVRRRSNDDCVSTGHLIRRSPISTTARSARRRAWCWRSKTNFARSWSASRCASSCASSSRCSMRRARLWRSSSAPMRTDSRSCRMPPPDSTPSCARSISTSSTSCSSRRTSTTPCATRSNTSRASPARRSCSPRSRFRSRRPTSSSSACWRKSPIARVS